MAEGKNKDDWVKPMDFEIDPEKYSLEKIERAVKAGFLIEKNADRKKARVVGRVIIRGDKKTNDLDVSK